MKKQHGFSLVELLVIIAIIAVLLSLLFPALQRIRNQGKTVICMNNLKQCGTALQLYCNDHDGYLPYSSHQDYWNNWCGQLAPYMEGQGERDFYRDWQPQQNPVMGNLYQYQDAWWIVFDRDVTCGNAKLDESFIQWQGYPVFHCPVSPHSMQQGRPWDGTFFHRYGYSYAVNEYLLPSNHRSNCTGTPLHPIPHQVKASNVENPGRLIVACDSTLDFNAEAPDTLPNGMGNVIQSFLSDPVNAWQHGDEPVPTPGQYDKIGAQDWPNGPGWPVYARHGGVCPSLMLDGHVQIFKNGQMKRKNFISKGGNTYFWGANRPTMYYP